MGYSDERQPFLVEKKDEIEDALVCIAEHFNIKWLKKEGGHPLQILWKRKDTLAGSELFFFGTCLLQMATISPGWVKSNVNKIKVGSSNERIGHVFEVICLGMLAPFFTTIPSPMNKSGFDGIVELSDKKKVRLSIKSYGLSRHYQDFLFHSEKIEKYYQLLTEQQNISASSLYIDSNDFITLSKWQLIEHEIKKVISKFSGTLISTELEDTLIAVSPLENEHIFFPDLNSYHVLLTGKYHNNEKKNLFDKLDDAYYNLNKYAGIEDEQYKNIVFIHLPPNASIHECSKWTYDYYNEFPQKQISGVFFYQPLIAREIETNYPYINHFIVGIMNGDKFKNWNTEEVPLRFNIPVGKFANQIAIQKIVSVRSNKIESVEIPDRYLFQRGNYYFTGKQEDNSFTANINLDNIASGIIAHGVIQLKPNTPFMVISPNSQPSDDLLLL